MRDYRGRALLGLEKDGNYYVALLQAPNPSYNPQAEGNAPFVVERVHQAILERDGEALGDELSLKVYQLVSAREKNLPPEEQQRLAADYEKFRNSFEDLNRIYHMVESLAYSRYFENDGHLVGEEPNLNNLKSSDIATNAARIYFERNKFRILKERPELSNKHVAVTADGIVKIGSDQGDVLAWVLKNRPGCYIGILEAPLIDIDVDPMQLMDEEFVELYKKLKKAEAERRDQIIRPRH